MRQGPTKQRKKYQNSLKHNFSWSFPPPLPVSAPPLQTYIVVLSQVAVGSVQFPLGGQEVCVLPQLEAEDVTARGLGPPLALPFLYRSTQHHHLLHHILELHGATPTTTPHSICTLVAGEMKYFTVITCPLNSLVLT